jgi:hypothetical protein
LYNHNVPPSTISRIMGKHHGEENETFLPKTIFNVNEKCGNLINIADGILPTCTEAEKTIKVLEK